MIPLSSDLPNELVVKILDTLASSDRQNCLALCLVSSWTRRIALPHLLHTVVIRQQNRTAFMEGVIINGQLASYVKQLCIGPEHDSVGYIIASCTSITALTASPDQILSLEKATPFEFLTHFCNTHYPLTDAKIVKRLFPQLTHFAGIVYSARDFGFHTALVRAYGAQLVMVVVRVRTARHPSVVEWVRAVRRKENNLYIMDYGLSSERDWEEDASGRDSVWDSARKETQSLLA